MKRLHLIAAMFLIFGFILLFRIGYLQIWCHEEFSAKADAQKFHTVALEEVTRGDIFDCNGSTITSSDATPSLMIVPLLVDNTETMAKNVAEISELSAAKLKEKTEGINGRGEVIKKQPFIAKIDLTNEESKKLEELNEGGVYVISRQDRYYGDFPAQHLLGCLGKDDSSEMTYGISGLERIYNDVLSADSSTTVSFLLDERNRMIDPGEYYISASENTKTGAVHTTIDLGIQRAAESALGDLSGAVVVLDSNNGDVLALVSSLKFDPFLTTIPLADDVYVNKALSSYPPASLFKIFVSAVALEKGTTAKETVFYCDGSYELKNGTSVKCWKKEGHGFLTFEDALAQSCNPVFVKTTLDLGSEELMHSFHQWGLDEDILLGYPLKDISSLKIAANNDAALANAGLGEDGVQMTPLNVAKMINVIASRGMVCVPRVVTEIYDKNGTLSDRFDSAFPLRVLSKQTADTVAKMMAKTFQEGTAKNLGLENFYVAGKTGTSETGNVWIGGFFPYNDPQYTIVILVTGGTSGATDGGPVLKKLCAYLGNLM